MKKIDYNSLSLEGSVYAGNLIGTINELINLVNSQQEAIEKLERRLGDVDSLDGSFNLWGRDIDKRLIEVEKELSLRPIGAEIVDKGWTGEPINKVDDTHRTVTLRIPKGMTFVESLFYADLSLNMSDNEAQKALDEVKGESNDS